MDRRDSWSTLVSAAGAAGAAVGVVYLIGGAVTSLRYEGFGLSGRQGVAVTPRELLLVRGTVSLVIWTVVGVVLVLALELLSERVAPAISDRLTSRPGLVGMVAAGVVLLLVLHVWWPLLAYGAILTVFFTSVHWRERPLARFLLSAVAVAAVAAAFEADRLSFLLERSCADVADEPAPVCGILIGQNDRGLYLGVPEGAVHVLVFLPAARLEVVRSEKGPARVIESRAAARRKPLRSRLIDLDVR